VHNSFLALWLNTGIIGLILWIFAFLRTISKAMTRSYMTLPFFYAVLFSAFFEPWLMGSLNPYTITFLFALSLLYINSNLFADHNPEPSNIEGEPLPLLK
jgi:O-antigen ligase